MYIVTFYSFKGGVGRTMSLVNVAAQLATEGKKVLMVDFDLEAPGLSSFEWDSPKKECRGVVEYVTDYRASLEAPDVKNYVYLAEKFPQGGEIWHMPAGKHDSDYSSRLNSIDWRALYEHEQGYVLFEDLKAQWAQAIEPDYVLIDSRTGHSDVEGICTRQLPDAVCLLFFPNEQNLQGLARVGKSIVAQNEKRKNVREAIKLHFVASNVPDLDDEEEIVGTRLERFKAELGYESLSATIHHYNSLSLLNQEVFSLTRPKSRLAREYVKLSNAIVRENLSERSAAVSFLTQTLKAIRGTASDSMLTESLIRVEDVLQMFPSDGEIGYRVALIFEAIGRLSDALILLNSQELQTDSKALSMRARLNHRLGHNEQAIDDLSLLLDLSGAELSPFLEAMSYIGQLAPKLFDRVPESEAFRSLSRRDKIVATQRFDAGRQQLNVQAKLWATLLENGSSPEESRLIKHGYALALVGVGRFEKAVAVLTELAGDSPEITDYFNLGMASWGLNGEPAVGFFEKVVEIDEHSIKTDFSPNYFQCLGIAHAILGSKDISLGFIARSRELMTARPRQQFSAWTYSRVNSADFLRHLQVIENYVAGGRKMTPAFLIDRELSEDGGMQK
jgi:MinD-like ATPase involved in chromosome partitioning or flagellar assembly